MMKPIFTQTCSEVSMYVEEKLYQLLSDIEILLPTLNYSFDSKTYL